MTCTSCKTGDTKVVDSRLVATGQRRRRECLRCGARFSTIEVLMGTPEDRREAIDVGRALAAVVTVIATAERLRYPLA